VIEQLNATVAQAVNMLRDARITMYTIDPTALSAALSVQTDDDSSLDDSPAGTGTDPFGGDINFPSLAISTGGKAFYSRNDVDHEVGESVRDGVNYYTLTYHPTSGSDAERPYRKIHVHIDQPGLHAIYRQGYYTGERADAAANPTRVPYDMDSAEENTLVYTGLSLSAAAKEGVTDTYVVEVPERQLVWALDGETQSSRLTLVAVAMSAKGRILRRVTDELTARRPATSSAADFASAIARLQISLPKVAGAVRLRFVLRGDADGRMGTADLNADGSPLTAPKSH
jgi:hypothetical protein